MQRLSQSPRDPGLRRRPLPFLRPCQRGRTALPLGGLRLSLRRRPRRGLRAAPRPALRTRAAAGPEARAARAPRRFLRARRPLDARPRTAGPHPPARPRPPRLHLAPHRRPRARDRRVSRTALADALPDAARFDLLPAFAERLPVVVIARLLGVPERGCRDLLAWSHAMVAMYQARRDRGSRGAANAAAATSPTSFATHVAGRRRRPGRRPDHRAVAADAARRPARHRGADRDLRPPAQCRPRGDGPRDRQRRRNDPRPRARAGPAVRRRADAPRRPSRRSSASTRPCTCSPASPSRTSSAFGHALPTAATPSAACSRPPNRDPARFPRPAAFDPGRRPVRTSRSARASISASARRSPGSSSRSPCRSSSPAGPTSPSLAPPRFADRYHFRGLEALRVRPGAAR